MTATLKEKQVKAFDTMKAQFGYTNRMQSPKLSKIIVSSGVGSVKDKKKIELIAKRLETITGQKAAKRGAKKSVAGFKVREGDVVGYQVTLRGARMYGFLEKLLNVALPRTRDFRGISTHGVDQMGNYSLGIKENTIFPETADEELKDVFGLSINIVTTAPTKAEAVAFFTGLGFPFKKEESKK